MGPKELSRSPNNLSEVSTTRCLLGTLDRWIERLIRAGANGDVRFSWKEFLLATPPLRENMGESVALNFSLLLVDDGVSPFVVDG